MHFPRFTSEFPPPSITADRIAVLRRQIEAVRHQASERLGQPANGFHIASELAAGVEHLLCQLVQDHLNRLTGDVAREIEEKTAVLAVGGTGRNELSFGSDVDVLFLSESVSFPEYEHLVSLVVRDCWDAKLQLSQKVLGIGQAVTDARKDLSFATALVESRLLWGSPRLFTEFQSRWQRTVVGRNPTRFFSRCIEARQEERMQFGGNTVSQLEPNIKKSYGGLRDLHLIRWLGFARFGTAMLDSLKARGALPMKVHRRLIESYEFLLRLRLELHLESGAGEDVLTREDQLALTRKRRFEDQAGRRDVEQFMGVYFSHAATIAETSDAFVERHQPKPFRKILQEFFTTHRAEKFYLVSRTRLGIRRVDWPHTTDTVEGVLHIYRTAQLYRVSLAPELRSHLRDVVPTFAGDISDESLTLFFQILSQPIGLGRILRGMREVGLLELLIPEFGHTRYLLQFNQYHHYTVDEHTFRVIEAAEEFLQEGGSVADAYERVESKAILHLALLLHDAGKGYPEDHSIRGAEIAQRVGERLQLETRKIEFLVFLVRHHLDLSHLAFRRDYTDPKLLVEFSSRVGSVETLTPLYVLTACDLAAVGSNVWTSWKGEILADVYSRLKDILSGIRADVSEGRTVIRAHQRVKEALTDLLTRDRGPQTLADFTRTEIARYIGDQFRSFAHHYLVTTPPDQIAQDILTIADLKRGEVVITTDSDPETGTIALRVIVHPELGDGCFHRITGALSAERVEILSADIATSAEGVVVDSFVLTDPNFSPFPPVHRIAEIREYVRKCVSGEVGRNELKRRTSKGRWDEPLLVGSGMQPRVEVDTSLSDRFTVIDVFAYDRPGLLYRLTRTIHRNGLDVALAKISTHLDQVVDVFYVTERSGAKLRDRDRIRGIKEILMDVIRIQPPTA